MIDRQLRTFAMTSKKFLKERKFWQEKVSQEFRLSQFPVSYEQDKSAGSESYTVSQSLSPITCSKLLTISNGDNVGLYVILLSAVNYVLHRYTGNTAISVGSCRFPAQNMEMEDDQDQFLILSTDIDPCRTMKDLLMETRKTVMAAVEHQHFPVQALFESPIPLHTYVCMESFCSIRSKENVGEADMGILFATEEERIDIHVTGKMERYNQQMIKQITKHISNVLDAFITNPSIDLREVPLFTIEEESILSDSNDTVQEFPMNRMIHEAFEEVVSLSPDKWAIDYEGEKLTFSELNEESNRLARVLISKYKIQTNDLIGIHIDRSNHMVIAMLAVLKTGAAYVPLDPGFPEQRILHIIQDSELRLVLSEKKYEGRFNNEWLIDEKETQREKGIAENLGVPGSSNQLAYVIYTSGSTGVPKGVMITHRNVSNFFSSMNMKIPVTEKDVMLSVTTISFDISVLELLWALTRGMQVVINATGNYDRFDRYVGRGTKQKKGLDFSLFFFSSYASLDEKHKYKLLQDTVTYGDKNGYKAVWTPERHFHEFGGLYPNPAVTSAALAVLTEHIQIRSGSIVSPLHDSIRITEDWAVVDNLSNGRAGLSFAPGWHTDDFTLGKADFQDRYLTMYNQIDEVRKLWQGEAIDRLNGKGKTIQVQTYPRPVQKELPIWVTTGGSRETYIKAGRAGANLLTHLLGQDLDTLAENIEAYRTARAEAGFNAESGTVSLMLHTYMDNDLEAVRRTVYEPFKEYLRSNIGLWKKLADNSGLDEARLTSDSDIEQLLEISFEKYWNTLSLMGTPETCTRMVEKLMDMGVDEIACLIDFGIEEQAVMDSLEKITQWKKTFESQENQIASAGDSEPVTIMQTTPSLLKIMVNDTGSHQFIESLQTLLVGGEAISASLISQVRELSSTRIFNMYGPTETTIWSSVHEIQQDETKIGLGKPIGNTQIHIVDDHLNKVPFGVLGEICIGGEGVGRGYLKRESLTYEKFIEDPFTKERNGAKLYRTGDLGYRLPDGNIVFMGRQDFQVKIRGHRVELGEVEEAMGAIEGVQEAVAAARIDIMGDTQLVVYFVSHEKLEIEEIREVLEQKLPIYMLPSVYVPLKHIPLTPNGKVDRVELNKVAEIRDLEVLEEAPSDAVQELLLQVWKQTLGLDKIHIRDNFFHIGGDSIKAIQVASSLQKHGKKVEIKEIFSNPTIEQLAPFIHAHNMEERSQAMVEGEIRLTPIQQWFYEQNLQDKNQYNHAVMLYNRNGWDEAHLRKVFDEIVEHHDALRMRFKLEGGANKAYNQGTDNSHSHYRLEIRELYGVEDLEIRVKAECDKWQASLDLAEGPLVQLGILRTDMGDHLLIVVHHLVVDGISWRILFEDIANGYEQSMRGNIVQFQQKTSSFKEWSDKLYTYANSEELQAELEYWNNIEEQELNSLKKDRTGVNKISVSERVHLKLSKEETSLLLREVNIVHQTEINDVLLAALSFALHQWQYGTSYLIDLEGHGRGLFSGTTLDISRTVGWFTSLYPILLSIEHSNIIEHVQATKEYLKGIPDNGLGYGVLRYLNNTTVDAVKLTRHIKPEIMFNYLGQFDQDIRSNVFEISPFSTGENISGDNQRSYVFEFNGKIHNQQLIIELDYSKEQYDIETVQSLLSLYKSCLQEIINTTARKPELARYVDTQQFEPFPLTEVQMAYYLGRNDELGLGGVSPHNYSEVEMKVDLDRFERSLNKVIQRHGMLRAVFKKGEQMILPQVPEYKIEVTDLSIINAEDQESWVIQKRQQMSHRKFKPDQWPLFEIKGAYLGEGLYKIFVCYDLLITDAISAGIINKNLMEFYENEELQLPELTYTFRDYMLEYQKLKKSDLYMNAKSYWIDKLESFPLAPEFDYRCKPRELNAVHFKRKNIQFSKEKWNAFVKIANEEEVTPSALLCTIYAQVLAYWSNQPKLAINLPIINRYSFNEQVAEIVGEFTSILPLAITFKAGEALFESARLVQVELLEAIANRHYDGIEFIRELSQRTGNFTTPNLPFVFTSLLFQDPNGNRAAEDYNSEIDSNGVNQTSQTYLDCQVIDVNGNLSIWWDYIEELFEEEQIQTMFDQFVGIIEQVVSLFQVGQS